MKLLLCHPGSHISTGDMYTGLVPALRRRGHEVIEYPLASRIDRQANWLAYNYRKARKVDPDIPKPTWPDALYLAAERLLPIALRELPDWTLVMSGMFFHPDVLILMQRARLPIGLLLTESPYDDAKQFTILPAAQVVWTNERRSLDVLRLGHPNTHYLPHAFDPERHRPRTQRNPTPAGEWATARSATPEWNAWCEKFVANASGLDADIAAHDVVFVGTGFQERIDTLAAVDWTGIDLGLYGNWDLLPRRHPLRQYVRGREVPNTTTVELYRRAKVGLNLYRTSMGYGRDAFRVRSADSLNPRALELAACGVFTISDHRAEVEEVFGDAVPTFKTPTEAESLIRRWLADDAGRAHAAARLPALVQGRTFDAMAAQIEQDFVATMERLKERAHAA